MVRQIADVHPQTPADQAATRILQEYLAEMAHYARLVRKKPGDDVEHVHQLRVSTRRASSALRVFDDFLPRKVVRRLERTLPLIRQAAGDARDLDVFRLDLEKSRAEFSNEELAGLRHVEKVTRRLHHRAVAALADTLSELREHGFWKWCQRRVDFKSDSTMDSDSGSDEKVGTLAERARASLMRDLKRLYDRHERCVDVPQWDGLHRLRIAGKRLRYSMEIFLGCFDSTFHSDLYATIKTMQDILGVLNDDHVFAERFREMAASVKPSEEELRRSLDLLATRYDNRLVQHRRIFEDFWHREMGVAYRMRFLRILGEPEPDPATFDLVAKPRLG